MQQIKLLGIMGRAYHKVGLNGRKYIVFKGLSGLRPDLGGTRYLANNPKVACFVVGSRAIIEDAAKATKIAVVLLVAYDVIREFHEDHFSLASLGVRILSDVIQAAGAAAFGAAAGVVLVTLAFPVVVTFVIVVIVGFAAGVGLTLIDQQYHLTDRARARMMGYEESLKKNWWELENAVKELSGLVSDARQIIYTVNKYWKIADDLRRWNMPNQYNFR